MFTQNLLDVLPTEEKHCQTEDYNVNEGREKKILYPTYDESGRIVNYNFDAKTNEMAFPKLGNLEGSLEVHKRVLERFENDLKNVNQVMQSKVQEESTNESEDNDEAQESSQNTNKSHKYQQLKERINRLNALVQEKKETIEYLQVSFVGCFNFNSILIKINLLCRPSYLNRVQDQLSTITNYALKKWEESQFLRDIKLRILTHQFLHLKHQENILKVL